MYTASKGAPTFDLVPLPSLVRRVVIRSAGWLNPWELRLGTSGEIESYTKDDIFDSEWCSWQSPEIYARGTGELMGKQLWRYTNYIICCV